MVFRFDADWIELMIVHRMVWQSSKSDVSLRDCGGWEIWLSLGDLREYTFLPTSLFLLPIYFNQALDLLTAFGRRRLFVRRCPIEKSAWVGNLFATGSDDGWISYVFDRTLHWLSIDVTIIAIRRVFKRLWWLGDLWQCQEKCVFSEICVSTRIWCKSIDSIVDSMYHRIAHRSDYHVTSDHKHKSLSHNLSNRPRIISISLQTSPRP